MLIHCFTFRRGYFIGRIVSYTGSFGDEAWVACEDGGRVYLCRNAVEGYTRLWEG